MLLQQEKIKKCIDLSMQSKIQEYRDQHKAYYKEYYVAIETVKTNYIQHIITSSNNTSKVLWKFVVNM
jgi:DNA-binding ferritin-like protein (Dps family)